MRKTMLVLLGVLAFGALSFSAMASYDYPDPTGFDVHNLNIQADGSSPYDLEYPIFIHNVLVSDYSGSWPGPGGWTGGDYPWHERNLTNTRGMYPILNGGEGEFYWHGDFRGSHYTSTFCGGYNPAYGPWLHEEVPSASDPVYLEFYMGGLYPVNMMCVFNYSATQEIAWDDPAATYWKAGIQDVVIKYKQNQMDAWTTLGTYKFGYPPFGAHAYGSTGVNNQFGPFNDPNDTAFARPIKFGDRLIRYVQFEIISNWGDASFVGCNEIRFYAPGSAYILYPTKMLPYSVNNFGPIEVGGKAHQSFTVMNAGTENSMMIFNELDQSLMAGTGFTLLNPIAPGADLTGGLLINGGISTKTLGTFEFSPVDVGPYTGKCRVRYTDAFGTHRTTVTIQGVGRYGSWGSIWSKADSWRSFQTWDWCPSYVGFRMANGTNMNEPGKGMSGSRNATVGRYDPVAHTSAVWGWGHLSGYFGWYGWRHHWVSFDFQESKAIDEMLVWNSPYTNACAKDAIISYTTQDVRHYGEPQDEPDLGPGGYPSMYGRQRDQWANAYGHFSGVNDTRWTPLAGTNRTADAPGAHQFTQVMSGDWNHPPEVFDFGGVMARQVRFDFLHDGRPGAWGPRQRNPGVWSLQGWDTAQVTIPTGYGNWGNDWAIAISQVRFYSGGPYPQLRADLPAATGNSLRSWENPPRLEPFTFPTQYYPFVTTSTAVVIGNVGEAATSLQITAIGFADINGDGTPDPGPFSITGAPTLPKTYAAGTTESVTLTWVPLQQLGSSTAEIRVTATSSAKTNKASIPIRGTAMAYAPGYVKPSEIAAIASLTQLTVNDWAAALAYNRGNMMEVPAGVVGSKGGGQYRYGNWQGWLDNIGTGQPPLEDPHWLEIELDSVRTLDEMHIFQHSQNASDNWQACLKDIYIEYKVNAGDAWTRLGNKAWRVHNWYISNGQFPQPAYAANELNTHAPFKFPAATQAQFVRIVAAGPIGDNDPNQSGLYGNWGSVNYWGCAEVALYQPAPGISLSATTLDFGGVAVGSTLNKVITITNPGNAALQVTGVTISAPYSVVGSSAFSVAAGANQPLTIRFAPTARGDYSNAPAVIVNSAVYFSNVTLNGIGYTAGSAYTVAAPAGGSTIAFGDTNVGQPKTRVVLLRNLGDTALNVTAVGIVGSTAFAGPGGLPIVIAAGGQGEVKLTCTPPAVGDYAGVATLTLTGDSAVPTLTYSLTAKGVLAPPATANGDWIKYY